MVDSPIPDSEDRVERLTDILQSGSVSAARTILQAMHPAEIADVLESLPKSRREYLWELIDPDIEGDVLMEVHDEVRDTLVRIMDADELRAATEQLDLDDLADFIQSLPEQLTGQVLEGMRDQDRARLETVLFYPEDSAGGLMNLDTITVRGDVTLDVVLRYLRRRGEMPRNTDRLMVVDRFGHYQGELPIRRLLTHPTDALVATVMRTDVQPMHELLPAIEVARQFEDYDLVSAPVVDDGGSLIGRVTIDDVVDVIRDEAEQSVLSMAGLNQEDDIFSGVVRSARKRALWLGVNLLTAFLASWVIARFELTLDKIVTLAVLMTVVPSMGGIAGSQTLTLMIRGQALGQVNRANTLSLLYKELSVGLLNGCLWAVVVCAFAYWWFGDLSIGLLLGAALIITLIIAAFSGLAIPIVLRKLGIDPALAGGVVLTTVTDVVGLVTFLGLATLLLL
ncbi:MAG: magnesium transporter [Gammaproteobacteria bacterium]|nr:magnesium transporter [Gammaproteobacteria bacterium]